MSADRYSQRRRQARSRLTMLIALVAAAALGAAAFAFFTRDSGGKTRAEDQQHPSPSSGGPSSLPTEGTTEPTVLPKARNVKSGVPVGYPHTLKGAISAAAHFYDISDAFDPSASERQARITAQPGKEEKIGDQALRLSMGLRASARLPLLGESNNENYYSVQSRAYRVASANSDRVKVWILVDTDLSVRGVTKSDTEVQAAYLVWAAGDWKFTGQESKGGDPRPVVPDSAQAVKAGWRTLAYEK